MNKTWNDGFNNGVIAALLVLLFDKQYDHAREIIGACGVDGIEKTAKAEGDEMIMAAIKDFREHNRRRNPPALPSDVTVA